MKKLIKPRVGGGKEGRTIFTAAGSVENLADGGEFTSDSHAANPGETARAHTRETADKISQRRALALGPSPPKRGYTRAYKSTHDCQVPAALIPRRSPQISTWKAPCLSETGTACQRQRPHTQRLFRSLVDCREMTWIGPSMRSACLIFSRSLCCGLCPQCVLSRSCRSCRLCGESHRSVPQTSTLFSPTKQSFPAATLSKTSHCLRWLACFP